MLASALPECEAIVLKNTINAIANCFISILQISAAKYPSPWPRNENGASPASFSYLAKGEVEKQA